MLRLAPGRLLNAQLRLLSWLGEDFHGESFLGELRPPGRTVEVKVLRADACRTPAYFDRFRRTAELALAIQHEHVAKIYAYGILPDQPDLPPPTQPGRAPPRPAPPSPGYPWLATDYVVGPDLRTYLSDGVPVGVLGSLLLPIADLLDRAASMGLSHGEIVPSQIVLTEPQAEGTPPKAVLMDLGLAKVHPDDPLAGPITSGMLCYKSPEQCAGLAAEPASDRYALATILFEGVAGRPPFLAEEPQELMRLHRSAAVPPLRTFVPSFHRAPALDAFFVRSLAKQPQARFPSAVAMVEEFLHALNLPRDAREGLSDLPRRRHSSRWYQIRRKDQGESGASMNVVVGPRAVLGKQLECDVVCHATPSPQNDIITAGISREHAVLIWLDERLSVLDQSVNGTYVNSKRASSRLTPVPQDAVLRMGEHLSLRVHLLPAVFEPQTPHHPGVLIERTDTFAQGVAPTLMLWQRLALPGSPLSLLGGAMTLGEVWVVQRELFYSGHPAVVWERRDGTRVHGASALRHGDTLTGAGAVLTIEH